MCSSNLRPLAIVLLILSLAMFSGIATTVSALDRPELVDTCCDRGEPAQEPLDGPCTDADCLCFSCLTLDLATPLHLACSQQFTHSVLCPSQAFCTDGYTAGIDYPPEIA
jgi:hypothetical protein